MEHVLAIDLGASRCVLAVPEEHPGQGFRTDPRYAGCSILLDRSGQQDIPAVVAHDESGRVMVGDAARARAGRMPGPLFYARRLLAGADSVFCAGQEDWTAEQALSVLLSYLKTLAEERLQNQVHAAVIAVPALFSTSDSDTLTRAARVAGFGEVQLVREPLAVALAWSACHPASASPVLTCDIGAGKTELALLEKEEGGFRFLGVQGDLQFGGCDIDLCLAEWLQSQIEARRLQGIPPKSAVAPGPGGSNPCQIPGSALLHVAEQAKQLMAGRDSCSFALRLEDGFVEVATSSQTGDFQLTRNVFESLIGERVRRVVQLCRSAVAGFQACRLPAARTVILTGGSMLLPLVLQRLQEEFGQRATLFEPTLAVVLGTALYARQWSRPQSEVRTAISLEERANEVAEITLDQGGAACWT